MVISPQYVKPFVCRQKMTVMMHSHRSDSDATHNAVRAAKKPEQQVIGALYIVKYRTVSVRQIRGLLPDREIPIGRAVSRACRAIPLIIEDAENGLSPRMRRTIAERYDLFNDPEHRICFFDKEIETVFRQSEACQHIDKVKGIGPKTTTAVVAAIGKGTEFKNGHHFAAWSGSTPALWWLQAGADEYNEKRRQASANLSSGLPRIIMMVI